LSTYIARVWHGITRESDAQAFLLHIEKTRITAYRASTGNCGALCFRRISNGVAEFLVISFWNSLQAVKIFVGSDDLTSAIYHPDDLTFLQFPEPRVAHYQLEIHEGFLTPPAKGAPSPLLKDPFCETA
jgi:hypothetical protein